jgi:hypothetical protein
VFKRLLNGKALGSDGILNKVLKTLSLEIAEGLAQAISTVFVRGMLPGSS